MRRSRLFGRETADDECGMAIFCVLDELLEDRAFLIDGQVERGEP